MGRISDKHDKRKRRSDNDPLSGEIGNRDINTNDFDIEERTIKDQQNKKKCKKEKRGPKAERCRLILLVSCDLNEKGLPLNLNK